MVAAGAAALYAGWTPRPGGASSTPRAVDSNVVAVLPFGISGSDPALADLRDWTQDLLVARLTGEGSPRALDPRDVSEALRRAGNSRDGDPSAADLRRIQDQLGAGLLLRGEVAGTPARLSLAAALVAVPSRAVQAAARVEGSADSLPYLADRLTARLLAVRAAAGGGEDLATLTSTSLSALRAYLAGRTAYRRGLIHPAEEYFQSALLLDSTFAPAGLGLAAVQTNYWHWRDGDERWQADALWGRRHRMTPADRALLVAYLGPRYPRPSTSAEMIAAGEEAARVAPDRVEAWYIAAASLWRFAPLIGSAEWEARSVAALRRAFVLDSTHAPTLDALLEFAADAGDTAAVRRYARLYFAHNAGALTAGFVRWRAAVALGDSAALVELRPQFARMGELTLWRIIGSGQGLGGVGMEDADRALEGLLSTAASPVARGHAMRHKVRLLLNRGRPAEVSRMLAGVKVGSFAWREAVEPGEFRVYAALYWDGDTTDAAVAVRQLEAYVDSAPSNRAEVGRRQMASCAVAHWRAASGDADGARTALARIGRVAPTDMFAASPTAVCVAAVEAMLAAGRPEPHVIARTERLDSLLRATGAGNSILRAVGHLIVARLYEARGDLPRALDAVRRASGPFLSTQRREEGRLAALNGDRAGAIRAYRHYLELRSDPEPALRPEVERVRAALERLEGGTLPRRGVP